MLCVKDGFGVGVVDFCENQPRWSGCSHRSTLRGPNVPDHSKMLLSNSTLFRRIGVLPATSRSTTTTMPTKVYVACVREGGREATVTRAPHMSQRSTSVVVMPSGFLLRCLRKDMIISLVFEVWIMVPQGPSTSLPYTGGGGGGEPGGQFWSFTECHQDQSW